VRLTNLKPSLPRLSSRVAAAPPPSQHWKIWYTTKRWSKLRWSVLTRDLFTCQLCRRVVADTSKLVCDHIEPHRGDAHAFWTGPFRTLCAECHDALEH